MQASKMGAGQSLLGTYGFPKIRATSLEDTDYGLCGDPALNSEPKAVLVPRGLLHRFPCFIDSRICQPLRRVLSKRYPQYLETPNLT